MSTDEPSDSTGDTESDTEGRKSLNVFQFEVDPEKIEESVRGIGEKARQLALDSTHTKVRIKYRGKQLGTDLPLGVFVAAEAATFWYGGLFRAILMNLGMKALLEVEFIHHTDEKVDEGRSLYEEGEVDAAEKCYREALSIRSDDPSANYHLGVLLRVTGRRNEAIERLEIAASDESFIYADKAQKALDKMRKGKRTL